MGLLGDMEIPKRELVVFFIVDTAGYMGNGFLKAINSTMHEVVPI